MRSFATRAAIVIASIVPVSCGGDAGSEAPRTYTVALEIDDSGDRYRYVATGEVDIRVGDEVEFVLDNTGTLVHDLHIVDPDGVVVATSEVIPSGLQTSVTARFDQAGFYRLNCLVDDHLTVHEMQSVVEVTDSSG